MTGMTRVVIIQDANITQKYQELLRKLESMGGQKVGRHVVHCRLFNRKTLSEGYSNQRMFMLRMSQNDDLVYAVLVNERLTKNAMTSDNGIESHSEECSLLECGLDGANILQQVEIYAFKSDGQFEGTQYIVGDFVVSVCTFMSRNNLPRGLTIEVQYTPCYTVSSVETLFDEFLMNFASLDRLRKPIDSMHALFDKVGLPSGDYSLKHTALQYVAAFNILRRRNGRKKKRREGDQMDDDMATAALFGGDDPRFDVVDITSELPPPFSMPSFVSRSDNSGDRTDALSAADAPVYDETDADGYPTRDQEEDADGHRSSEMMNGTTNYGDRPDGHLSHRNIINYRPKQEHHEPESKQTGEEEEEDSNGSGSLEATQLRKAYPCQYANCHKFAQAGGFCISHGGGKKCQTPFCPFFNLRTCPEHGGSKRCGVAGCTKVALGALGLCCAHGGGRKCSIKVCTKFDAGLGYCLSHGGGRNCSVDGCTKKQIRYGFCSGHGGRARCKVEGCEKYDRGQGKCKAHGGGYFCKVEGCTKKDKGGGLCAAHGGGKKCSVEGCRTPCVGGGRCKLHGGGKRCQAEGCRNWALNAGKCKEHGGAGKRCSHRGCDKHDQGGGRCLAHGGGYKCNEPGCPKKQIRAGFCCAHGGKPRCSVEGCKRLAQNRGLCKGHGGSKPCMVPDCTRKANSGGRCITHGGGGRCRSEGCTKTNRGGGYCKAHGGGKKCNVPDCKEWAIGGGACPQHEIFGSSSVVCV